MATLLTDTVIPGFEGELLTPGAAGYDEVTGEADRPALIARCASTADVRLAVCHAVLTGTRLGVRGGGRGATVPELADGGLLIDLAGLRDVHVDGVARTAVAGGGATWGELDAACAAEGLAVVDGRTPTAGAHARVPPPDTGWLGCSLARAADGLLAAELVTGHGEVVLVDAETQPELLWGLRSAGPTPGVVTSCTLRLHPVPPRALRPWSPGAVSPGAGGGEADAVPGAAEAARLRALRRRWDPQGVFVRDAAVPAGG